MPCGPLLPSPLGVAPCSHGTDSLASRNAHERGLSVGLAEKDACELQRSFESAALGDDGGNEKDEDDGSGDGDDSDEDRDDKEGVPAALRGKGHGQDTIVATDIDTPGLFALAASRSPMFADGQRLPVHSTQCPCVFSTHTASYAKAWVSVTPTSDALPTDTRTDGSSIHAD